MVQAFEYVGNVSIIVIRFKRSREECCYENKNQERSSTITTRSTSPKNGLNILRNIEERLEQISEAINKIDDDSSNNWKGSFNKLELMPNSINRSLNENSFSGWRSGSSIVSKNSTSRVVSPSSAPPDPHNDQESTYRFSIRKKIDMFDRLNAAAIIDSKERFQRAKLTLDEQLRLRTPEGKIIKLYNV
ncbi:unnamed protein product [Onchocerca flexuosa]|uniref:Uncharacterized protein n=1 Tax=Onchocerca flexuosa TaxID=387005 RepID=A0A183I5U6_9BILA|nr:unnamed protein product [Onchocerca flexuosa]